MDQDLSRFFRLMRWTLYAMRLAKQERAIARGELHSDNWIDEVYAWSGERWSEIGL